MKPVRQKKHWTQIGVDEVGFYFAKGCKVFPPLQDLYTQKLKELESKGLFVFTPEYLLLRYQQDYIKRLELKYKRKTA